MEGCGRAVDLCANTSTHRLWCLTMLVFSPAHVRVLAGDTDMMNSAQQEWMKLCDQVIHEQDPERFFQLIVDINNMLWVKQNRLIAQRAKKLKVN